MKIDINKNFEEAFPNEFYSGFTLRQCLAALIGLVISIGAAFLLWKYAGMPIVECTYITIPLMIPFCAIGFFEYQNLSAMGLIKEILYYNKTRKLLYQAGEHRHGSERVIRMQRTGDKDKKKRMGKRKRLKTDKTKKTKKLEKRVREKKGEGLYGSH